MIWVLVLAGIALLGLVGLVAYAVWLWHKAEDVLSEVEMVGRQAEEILDLLDDITPFDLSLRTPVPVGVDGEDDDVRSGQADLHFEPDLRRGHGLRPATERHH